jgi:ribosomal protein S18 acetylase RimI-like enzyme
MDQPSAAWWPIYLAGLSDNRKAVALRLVAGVPAPRVFIAARRDGIVVSSGLTVLDGELASIQCMATHPDVRRSGGATAVLCGIESVARAHGVSRLYLQTGADNAAAIALYERFGFSVVSRYHTRDLKS